MTDHHQQTSGAVHELKCWPAPFSAMRDGSKRFEYRRDDRNYQIGDILWNREWKPPTGGDEVPGFGYTGREDRYRVTYKLAGRFGVPDGFCVLSIEPIAQSQPGSGEVERLVANLKQRDDQLTEIENALEKPNGIEVAEMIAAIDNLMEDRRELGKTKKERDDLRAQVERMRGEIEEAKSRTVQAWKDADLAVAEEVERKVASIMGSPDNEIARQKASKETFRDERDRLQIENGKLREQLAHARSRGDDKEIAEKERDRLAAQLSALTVKVSVPDAIVAISNALRDDPGYYEGWQANIAMAFKDTRPDGSDVTEDLHRWANRAADRFLTLLMTPALTPPTEMER